MNRSLLYFFIASINYMSYAQEESISGTIVDKDTNIPLSGVIVQIQNSSFTVSTKKSQSKFTLKGNLPLGEQLIIISKEGYIIKKFPIVIYENTALNLGSIELSNNFKDLQEGFTIIDISENNIQENENQHLLSANKDPFLKSAAYNWSSTFFKTRGLGNEYAKILINGVEMNKPHNNRPKWNNWAGLNDVLKSQEVHPYTHNNENSFGDINGVTQFHLNANAFSKSSKISISSTNRSYQKRIMVTHHSGMLPNNWAYSFSASIRNANQGYINGTNLNAFAFFGSIEHKINNQNNISLNIIYTPVERGKTSPNTKEITDLKGIKYNSYWGLQNDKIRNSRVKKVKEPIFTLSHFWNPTDKLNVKNNLLFQKGFETNSRLDYTGTSAITVNNQIFYEGIGSNPDPAYYQKLPSFFISNSGNENFEAAFLANKDFINDGQINWKDLHNANNQENGNATYILYNDKMKDQFIALNSILNYNLAEKITLNSKISFHHLNSHNYAQVSDLLGSNGYLDIDAFSNEDNLQNNVLTPNRIVSEGDDFKYNYNLISHNYSGYIQASYSHKKWSSNISLYAKKSTNQRTGNYENGRYPNNLSFGKSKKIKHIGWAIKTNNTYQINPKNYISSHLLFKKRTPILQNIFTNARQSNILNSDLKGETNTSIDINYNYQYNGVKTRLSTYWIERKNNTKNSFFFTQDVAGLGRVENADFFQELTTGINIRHLGIEIGSEIELTSSLTLQLSSAIGQHIYTNNPSLQITSDSSSEPVFTGQTALKNYHIANGPQQAYGLGFSYRDPNYWWFSSQLNFFNNSYINISPFLRTTNFVTDIDGLPFSDFNEKRANTLLKQEQFSSYFLWNAIGGKSWRLKKKYLGITIGIQNILNQIYKTGGFEQSRNSNYQTLNEDQNREYPLFGNKYWHGTGTTFYINTYIRF